MSRAPLEDELKDELVAIRDHYHTGNHLEPVMSKQTVQEALRELVLANRILAHQNVVDAYGHVSIRHPEKPERYFMACSRAPKLVTLEDLLEFRLDGEPIDAHGKPLYAERAIHGSIYEARADVQAVCHNHSMPLIPFGVTGKEMRAIFHLGAVIGERVPIWDIRSQFGPNTNLLVTRKDMGDSLAKALGSSRVALMRGHGAVVVGRGLREAVYIAVQLQNNAQMLLAALAMGTPEYLTPGEIEAAANTMLDTLSQNRSWQLWAHDAGFPAG